MAPAHKRRTDTSPSSSSAPGHTAAPRKVVPIKHPDGQPLTRADIQFDFLNAVFADSQAVFTNPHAPSSGSDNEPGSGDGGTKITFRELYLDSILCSPKATKVLKDKMGESTMFAVDFAMLALLVNVGRVNTTMSFFPGMKTTIRTYHPIPALSRTDGNLQDAPRIKHVLKSSLLPTEAKSTPATPGDILARSTAGKRPSTSVTNLIFVLAHHSGPVGQTHFEGQFTFLDLFLRTDTSSESRARIFLWLCYNYLESPSLRSDSPDADTNPFSDPAKKHVPPSVTPLTPEEMALENRETAEDVAVTNRLLSERNRVVLSQSVKEAMNAAKASMNGSVVGDEEEDAAVSVVAEDLIKGKGKAKKGAVATAATVAASRKGKGKRVVPAATTSSKEKKVVLTIEKSKAKQAMLIPDLDDDDKIDAFVKQRPASLRHIGSEPFQHPSALFATVPSQLMSRVTSDSLSHHSHTRYSPYARHSPSSASSLSDTRPRPRTMFQQAWHIITSTDPLIDSDNESGGDEYMRDDYLQRLEVIKRFSQQPWSQEQPPPPPLASEMETES